MQSLHQPPLPAAYRDWLRWAGLAEVATTTRPCEARSAFQVAGDGLRISPLSIRRRWRASWRQLRASPYLRLRSRMADLTFRGEKLVCVRRGSGQETRFVSLCMKTENAVVSVDSSMFATQPAKVATQSAPCCLTIASSQASFHHAKSSYC